MPIDMGIHNQLFVERSSNFNYTRSLAAPRPNPQIKITVQVDSHTLNKNLTLDERNVYKDKQFYIFFYRCIKK